MNYWLLRNEIKWVCPLTGITHYKFAIEQKDGMWKKIGNDRSKRHISKDFPPAEKINPVVQITEKDLASSEPHPKFNGFVYPEDIDPVKLQFNWEDHGIKLDHPWIQSREPENGRERLKQQYYDFVQAKKCGEWSECPKTTWAEPLYTTWSGHEE